MKFSFISAVIPSVQKESALVSTTVGGEFTDKRKTNFFSFRLAEKSHSGQSAKLLSASLTN